MLLELIWKRHSKSDWKFFVPCHGSKNCFSWRWKGECVVGPPPILEQPQHHHLHPPLVSTLCYTFSWHQPSAIALMDDLWYKYGETVEQTPITCAHISDTKEQLSCILTCISNTDLEMTKSMLMLRHETFGQKAY